MAILTNSQLSCSGFVSRHYPVSANVFYYIFILPHRK